MTLYNQIDDNKRRSWFIMLAFIAIVGLLGYIFGQALNYGYSLFVFAIIFATLSTIFSYYFSDQISLAITGAQEVTRQQEPRLFRTVENLSIGAGLVPMPKVYIIEDPALNAFATGRDPKHSAVAVTRGLLNRLDDLELEGVLAHELSHIKNFDSRTMTIAVVLVGIVALVSEWFMRMQFFGGSRDRNNRDSSGLMMILAIIGAILAPIFAQLLKFALSRQREFLADASGALLTRYPEGLARALEILKDDHTPLQRANSATAHLYIENPLEDRRGSKISMLFSTHPSVDDRIKRLRIMEKV